MESENQVDAAPSALRCSTACEKLLSDISAMIVNNRVYVPGYVFGQVATLDLMKKIVARLQLELSIPHPKAAVYLEDVTQQLMDAESTLNAAVEIKNALERIRP
jgi:hypothetical protein